MGSPNPILNSIILLSTIMFSWVSTALSQPSSWEDRAFFTPDVFLFAGHPFPSSPLHKALPVRQRFRSACANLNRIILTFAFEGKPSGRLTFRLFREEDPERPIYETIICS